jgi:predicted exporter
MNRFRLPALRRALALLWLAVVLAGICYLGQRAAAGLSFRADLMALVPREEKDPALVRANDAVTAALSQRVVLLVGDPARAAARDAAVELSRRLAGAGLIDPSTDGISPDRLKAVGVAYYPYRAGLLSETDRALLAAGRGGVVARRALAAAYGIGGMASAALLQNDPFLLLPHFLAALPVPHTALALDDGMLSATRDGKTWVLVSGTLKGEAYALDVQKRLAAVLDGTEGSLKAVHPHLTLLRTGAVFYARAGAETALDETSAIGAVSVVLTVLLLIAAFRSLYPLVLSLLVIGVGMATALSFSLWLWGELHVMALLFGVSLIGVTVDYSLQYFCEIYVPDAGGPEKRMKSVFAGITLGGATTLAGYLMLTAAPFPGLRQIALFSAVGMFAAWLTVALWLPFLDRTTRPARSLPFGKAIAAFLAFWRRRDLFRLRIGIAAALAVLAAGGACRLHAVDDVRAMQALSPPLLAQQRAIEKIAGTSADSRFFVVRAPSEEAARQREETLTARLEPLKQAGALSGFQTVAAYVPSARRQAENRAWVRERLYGPELAGLASALGLKKLPPVPAADAPALTPGKLATSGGASFLSLLRLKPEAGALHIATVEGASDAAKVADAARGIAGVRFFDPVREYSALIGKYRLRALGLLAVSAALMFLILLPRYGVRRAAAVMAPPLVAVAATPFFCALVGAAFTFFDVVALVLVLAMGLDYAVFFAETDARRERATIFAIALSAGTTIMSFGFLAFSSVMAVHNFGLTMLVGVLLSFLFIPAIGVRQP